MLRLTRGISVELNVPADAEFVLEGYVDNEDMRLEGPFGDHTGVYSLAERYPTFHVTCMTRRRRPIYAATVVGKPPMEDAWLGKATERIFLPLLQMVVPEIVDYNLPVEGGFHNLCIVSVKKSGKWLAWKTAQVSQIPNYFVFDALVRAILAQRAQAAHGAHFIHGEHAGLQ